MTTIQGNTQKTTKENAWHALCALTTELFPQFGRRSAAFAAACVQRPDLVAMSGAPVAKAASQGMRQAPPVAVDPSQSAVVKGCEARAASSQGTRQAPPVAPAVDDPGQSPIVKACEARAAASERRPGARRPVAFAVDDSSLSAASSQGTRQVPPAASAVDDPGQSPIVKACEARAASERRPHLSAMPPGAVGGAVGNALAADPSQSAIVKACEARAASAGQ